MRRFTCIVSPACWLAAILLVGTALPVMAQRDLDRQLQQMGVLQQDKRLVQPSSVKVARLHYSGGGDWYWGRSALPNFLRWTAENTCLRMDTTEHEISIMDASLFSYPFLFATGHGVIEFTGEERQRLRRYLQQGGFLFINDSYGMEKHARQAIAELFPERELVDIPFDHDLYHSFYDFPAGPPKIHEHDNNAPRGLGVIIDGRVVVYLLIESDIGDGWEDPQVHNDPPEKREEAMRMGVNILAYALLY